VKKNCLCPSRRILHFLHSLHGERSLIVIAAVS
jgi:hypothetical protein